ncbi:MAG: acyloxyacyl hydrolase [Muribaculaceae bacterium]|jgi:hypothetical protein|nr:acyloxyacyl hydrolase [Muribaculaceae bacterium]
MRNGSEMRMTRILAMTALVFLSCAFMAANAEEPDSTSIQHKLGFELRTAYVLPTNNFLTGDYEGGKAIRESYSAHARYAFQFSPESQRGKIFGEPYQGIGAAFYTFNQTEHLGSPFALYAFQGSSLKRLSATASLNYEWNFGVSAGWKPYNADSNSQNHSIGSKIDAYIDANIYVRWRLSKEIDLLTGIGFTHFSNGNTELPNAGLNLLGARIGIVYNLNSSHEMAKKQALILPFPKHFSCDVMWFGSWKRKGINVGDGQMMAASDAYAVTGFNINPMWNFDYRLRIGASVDGYYDASANLVMDDYIVPLGGNNKLSEEELNNNIITPPVRKQCALGLSARAEYVMPYFSINFGLGRNLIASGDLKSWYQILALKIGITRNTFLHVGYSLLDFHTPNFLMLGIGFRIGNKYPKLK